jgi:N-acyl homoserine lactone hydrolase
MSAAARPRPAELPLPGGQAEATVRVHPLLTGEALAPPVFFDRSGSPVPALLRAAFTRRSRQRWIPLPAFLVEHPSAGAVLVDTGLHPTIAEDPEENLGALMTRLFHVRMDPEQAVVNRLAQRGIAPGDVAVVVMTHLHWDHSSSVREFPTSTFVLDEREWRAASHGGVRQGYRREHIDHAFEWRTVDFTGDAVESFATFGFTIDLFGDGSVRLCSTPGHSAGHMSVLLRLEGRELLLTGDAAYTRDTITRDLIPLFVQDHHSYLRSLGEIHHYLGMTPEALVIAGHDPDSWPGLEEVYA